MVRLALAVLALFSLLLAPGVALADVQHDCVVGQDSIAECFPDEALAKDVAKAEHAKTANIFTQQMVDTTTKLNAFGELNGRIKTLKGIEQFANLTYLNIDNNDIRDISDLAKLIKLQTLYCSHNQISDLSPLAGLVSLQTLSVTRQNSSAQILDLVPLAALTALTHLNMSGNIVKSVAPLSGLINLNKLDISEDNVSDISSLSGLVNLTSLDVTGNSLDSIEAVQGMTHLQELYAGEQHNENFAERSIEDVSPLKDLTDLRKLDLSSNAIKDISSLQGLVNLRELWVGCNHIADIGALAGMRSLTLLSIDYNQIQSLEPLRGLSQLQELDACRNEISDISPLSGLTKLENTLDLSDNRISDISPLANCHKLEELDAENNNISNIAVLAKMPHTYNAQLDGNSVRDASLPAKFRDSPLLRRQYVLLADADPSDLSLQTAKDFDGTYIKPTIYPKSGHYNPMTGVVTWKSVGDADHISLTWSDASSKLPTARMAGTVSRHIRGIRPVKMHKVSFVARSNSHVYGHIPDQKVRDGDIVRFPKLPMTYDTHGFDGWWYGRDNYPEDAFNTPVVSDMKLEGRWDEVSARTVSSIENGEVAGIGDSPADEQEYIQKHMHQGRGNCVISGHKVIDIGYPVLAVFTALVTLVVTVCCVRRVRKCFGYWQTATRIMRDIGIPEYVVSGEGVGGDSRIALGDSGEMDLGEEDTQPALNELTEIGEGEEGPQTVLDESAKENGGEGTQTALGTSEAE
ncbi:leucine-rich repeat domain-containing protein [Bifidobacterium sp. ESL0690]|uniref:leucine-rich repeat domain-containing protein n=1 Tax=Bifidobacterium sp. ESL0690 TaxID=2983214 RepID=UPI0023F6F5BC|nr:leucine-rich repeat domain-containing protein [Bifidobacterium sp. ESL0690]WEV46474.1 leucine-rich repeat domain-containing protein [Bifidobacterium sp. ESL0690]